MSAGRQSSPLVLLLRGINVGGHRKVPMATLRQVCGEIGLTGVRTYVASGNVVAGTTLPAAAAAKALERAVEARLGFPVDVIAREGAAWPAYLEDNPFPAESEESPNRVMLLLANGAPKAGAEGALQERAVAGERVERVRDGLWIYYPAGPGTSKLTPSLVDRSVGAPTTARNWRTVQALAALLDAAAGEPG